MADPYHGSSVLGNQDAFEEFPRKLSLYAYSRLSPIVFRDPDGKDYEILVGGPYKDHSYGHVALRVFGVGYDMTYDFGRYAGETSLGEGPGALRVWNNSSSKYIAGENATGRTTSGYKFKTSKEEDSATIAHYNAQIDGAEKSKTFADKRGFKQYILKDDYHAVNKNCTTMCVDGVKAGKPGLAGNIANPKESKGRGLNWLERQMAGEVGEKIFMPADLKANIENTGGYYKHNEYKIGQEAN